MKDRRAWTHVSGSRQFHGDLRQLSLCHCVPGSSKISSRVCSFPLGWTRLCLLKLWPGSSGWGVLVFRLLVLGVEGAQACAANRFACCLTVAQSRHHQGMLCYLHAGTVCFLVLHAILYLSTLLPPRRLQAMSRSPEYLKASVSKEFLHFGGVRIKVYATVALPRSSKLKFNLEQRPLGARVGVESLMDSMTSENV